MAMRALRSARSRRKRGHTTGAIADYFEDKEAIVRAIIEPMLDEFDEMLDLGGEVEDIRKRFRRRRSGGGCRPIDAGSCSRNRLASQSRDGVIELMPTSDGEVYSFKYVNGHPGNATRGFQTVTGFGVLAKVDTGYPLMLAKMTLLTALRTAATSAMAARHLAPANARTMAMIGNGGAG